jgi:rfaE bifunctional protein nucleotidyltransferase chain/domain
MGKIVSLEELRSLRAEWRAQGQTLVLTNGCFDLLHVGHVQFLEAARRLGDVLVVGLNSDRSARRLKGPRHPLLPQADRAAVLAALSAVDYVVVFEETTAEALVWALQPEVYAKGGDYAQSKELPEADDVAQYGGRVEILPLVPGRSTTQLIEAILERYSGERISE